MPVRNKKTWDSETDEILLKLIKVNGACNWTNLSSYIPGRDGKQCRERWANQLNPLVNYRDWSVEESMLIFILANDKRFKNRWSKISNMITGRTDGQIKNYWNTHLKKHQAKMHTNFGECLKIVSKSNRSKDEKTIKRETFNKIIKYLLKNIEKSYLNYLH